jgi:hypothetical protein
MTLADAPWIAIVLSFREQFRDWVIIAVGLSWALMFLVLTAVLLVVGFGARAIVRSVRGILDDDVRPILENVKGTTETVRGTTEFMSEKAVSPVIRIYGIVSAVWKAAGVLLGLSRRRR